MPASLYDSSVPVFRQMLGSLADLLDKGEAYAKARNFDSANILGSRLAPDMLNLIKQVQIACDSAKGAVARLAGIEAPKHEDNEVSMPELKARIAATLEFINSVGREKIDGQENREIKIVMRDRTLQMPGHKFLMHRAFPNFFFHVTTAYNLLRHNGVDIGKKDFLGKAD